MPPTLVIQPDSTGYSIQWPDVTVNSGKLDGGASRGRTDVIGATGQANVQWTCNPTRYEYLQAFFRTTIENGVDSFYVGLIYDDANVAQFLCKFVPGTFKLASQKGLTYIQTASLEVYPNAYDPNLDASLVAIYSAYGDNAGTIFALLEKLVNVDLKTF